LALPPFPEAAGPTAPSSPSPVLSMPSCQQTAPPPSICSKDVTAHPHRLPGARPGRPPPMAQPRGPNTTPGAAVAPRLEILRRPEPGAAAAPSHEILRLLAAHSELDENGELCVLQGRLYFASLAGKPVPVANKCFITLKKMRYIPYCADFGPFNLGGMPRCEHASGSTCAWKPVRAA
jgi:hypothetical protein